MFLLYIMSNLLLIDTRVSDVDYIVSSLTENTTYILFDYHTDTLDTIKHSIVDIYANIGIVSHNTTKSEVKNTHYIDLSDGSTMPLIYNHVYDWYVDLCGNKYRQTPVSSDWMMNMATTAEPTEPLTDISDNQNIEWNTTEDVSMNDVSMNNVSWITDYNPNPVDNFTPHYFACMEKVEDNSSNIIPSLDVSGVAFEYILPPPLPSSDNISVSLGDLSNNTDFSLNIIDVSDGVIEPEVILFADIKTTAVWKKSWKMVENMGEIVLNAEEGDVSSWTDFAGFLESLKGKTAHLDFFACNLFSDPDWGRAFQYIDTNFSFVVRSSSDNTGYDGDYILESHQVSLIGVYFTDAILGYKYTLDILTETQSTYTPTFATSSIIFSNQPLTTNALAITDVSGSNNRLAVFASNTGLYTSVYNTMNNTWSTIISPTVSFDSSPNNTQYTTCCISNDARKMVVSVGTVGSNNNLLYWGDASGLLAQTSTSINLYRTLSTTPRAYMAAAISADGSKFVVSATNSSYIYFATWNGTNYSGMTPILDTTAANYVGVGLSEDGTRLLYTRNKTAYWSAWNGSNYAIGTAIAGTSGGQDFRALSFMGYDQSTIISTCQNGQPQYSLWNGSTYTAWNDIPISAMGPSDGKGLSVDSSGNIYSAPFGTSYVYASNIQMTEPIHSVYIGNYTTPITNNQTNVFGMGMTRVASTQLAVFCCSTYGLFYNRIINRTWGTTSQATSSFDVAPNGPQYRTCSISADGTRLIITVGTDGTGNFWLYLADASGVLNGTTSSLSFRRVDANQNGFLASTMTPDGNKIVLCTTGAGVYFSLWNGTGYNTLTRIEDNIIRFIMV